MFSCKPLTRKDLTRTASFLSEREQTCVALMSRLVNMGELVMPPPKFPYWILTDEQNHIQGVIMISAAGLVLHSFSPLCISVYQTESDLLMPLKKLITSLPLYCIMGSKEGTMLLQTLYERKVRCIREYELLTYKDTDYAYTEQQLALITLRRCTEKDTDSLFPLQKEYDKVEVLPDGDTLNETASRQNLVRLLKTQEVFAVLVNGHFCAKAGTNAQGLNWVQIGGVYTDSAWRNKGFARLLVSYIAHSFSMRKKKVTLFVKTGNACAKQAYHKAGFTFDSLYTILYYQQ